MVLGFYGVYHGPEGLKKIAQEVNKKTTKLAYLLKEKGYKLKSEFFFDTIVIESGEETKELIEKAVKKKINLRKLNNNCIGISLDETVSKEVFEDILSVFSIENSVKAKGKVKSIPTNLRRSSQYLQHPVFNRYHSETEMMRYIKRLYEKDIALD